MWYPPFVGCQTMLKTVTQYHILFSYFITSKFATPKYLPNSQTYHFPSSLFLHSVYRLSQIQVHWKNTLKKLFLKLDGIYIIQMQTFTVHERSTKQACNFIEIWLTYRCLLVNFAKTFRTDFFQNTSRWLLHLIKNMDLIFNGLL